MYKFFCTYIIIIIHYIYIALLWFSKHSKRSTWSGGISSSTTSVQHSPRWCDGSHIAPEFSPHTSLLVEREQWWSQSADMGMIRRPWWSEVNGQFGQDAEVTPLLFLESRGVGFLMTTASQDLGLTSHTKDGDFYSIVSPSHVPQSLSAPTIRKTVPEHQSPLRQTAQQPFPPGCESPELNSPRSSLKPHTNPLPPETWSNTKHIVKFWVKKKTLFSCNSDLQLHVIK